MLGIVVKTLQAAVVMLCHTFLGGISVGSVWAIKALVEMAGGGQEVKIYDRWPLEWLFQTTDVAIIAVVGCFGLLEMAEVLRKRSPD